jgi:hypothetical protein
MGSGGGPTIKAPKQDKVMSDALKAAKTLISQYYQPLDVDSAYAESMAALPKELGGLLDIVRAEGDKSAMRYRNLLTETVDVVTPAAQKIQDMTTAQWHRALSGIDPNWQSRLKGSQDSTDALVELANKYLTGQEASDLVTTGIVQSKRAQEISGDWLSGKLAASDQKALDLRTAETTSQFGQWGRASASMASGTDATANIISQQNLMKMGIIAAGQAGSAVSGAFGTLAGINQMGSQAAAQQQALTAQYMGPQLDVLGLYSQTLEGLAQFQTVPGQTIAQLGSGLYGAGASVRIDEQNTNTAQRMSYIQSAFGLTTDVMGAAIQAQSANAAASATRSAGQSAMIGSIAGGGLAAGGMVGAALII